MDENPYQPPQSEPKPISSSDDNPYQAPQADLKPSARRLYFSLLFIPGLLLAVVSAVFGTCAAVQSQYTGIEGEFWGITASIAVFLAVIAWAIFLAALKRSRGH